MVPSLNREGEDQKLGGDVVKNEKKLSNAMAARHYEKTAALREMEPCASQAAEEKSTVVKASDADVPTETSMQEEEEEPHTYHREFEIRAGGKSITVSEIAPGKGPKVEAGDVVRIGYKFMSALDHSDVTTYRSATFEIGKDRIPEGVSHHVEGA